MRALGERERWKEREREWARTLAEEKRAEGKR